jgi:transposase-like protein
MKTGVIDKSPRFALTTVQTCIIHLIRNTFRLASKKDWDALRRDVKPIYTAPNAAAASAAFEELRERWGRKYGAIVPALGERVEEFIPFLDYDVEIRGHPIPRSDRCRQDPMGRALEARFERLRPSLSATDSRQLKATK